jgi:hypothetical protein
MCPCTRVDVLQRDEKKHLCLKEALLCAPKTIVAPRDAANFLSSAANYCARREISRRIFHRCEKCPWNADFSRASAPRRDAEEKRFATRASVARASESCRRGPEGGVKNFFV